MTLHAAQPINPAQNKTISLKNVYNLWICTTKFNRHNLHSYWEAELLEGLGWPSAYSNLRSASICFRVITVEARGYEGGGYLGLLFSCSLGVCKSDGSFPPNGRKLMRKCWLSYLPSSRAAKAWKKNCKRMVRRWLYSLQSYNLLNFFIECGKWLKTGALEVPERPLMLVCITILQRPISTRLWSKHQVEHFSLGWGNSK